MTNIVIGIGATAAVFGMICGIVKYSKKQDAKLPDIKDTEIVNNMENLYGEVIGIAFDKNVGLSKIAVKDVKGKTCYGFSTVPIEQLNALYAGKGYVQIPVISERHIKLKTQGQAYEMKD